ncbi:MAG: hypothetical protein NVV63_11140 [Opitutus sp.]|nr:hypothetical protein [Opitutus sp.]
MTAILIIGAFFVLAALFGCVLVEDAREHAVQPDAWDDEEL